MYDTYSQLIKAYKMVEKTVTIKSLAQYLVIIGFSNKEELEKITGMRIRVHITQYNSVFTLYYTDPFYKSILGQGSALSYVGTPTAIKAIFEKRLRYKQSKIPVMESMRAKMIAEVIEKMPKWFGIDERLVKVEDIVFLDHCRISIGGALFNYNVLFTDQTAKVSEYIYGGNFQSTRIILDLLYKYFYGASLDTILCNFNSRALDNLNN